MIDQLKFLLFGDSTAPAGADEAPLAAVCLLVEAAMMDGAMDDGERRHILHLLHTRFSLSESAAEQLLQRATDRQDRSTQLFPFTRLIVENYAPAQRIDLIEMLWEVAYADGRLHDYEASLVRRIAGLVYVPDQESGAARRRALASLGLSDDPLV